MFGSCRLQGWHCRRSQKDWGYSWMGTTNKRPTDSQFVGLRWSQTKVHWGILHIARASRSTNVEEWSSCLRRLLRSKSSGAKGKTGVRTNPYVAHEICLARSVNICIPEKIGMCTRVTRQSGILSHKAIERSWEELSDLRLQVCGSVICLEDMDAISLWLEVWSSYRL